MKKWGKIFGTIILLVMLVLIMKGSVQADDVQIWDNNDHHVGYIDSSGIYHPNNQTAGLDFNRVGEDFQGQIYGITNGMLNISGFYSVVGPPAGYRPIGVGLTGDQGRLGGNKNCPDSNDYNCHDDESPVFTGTPFTVATPDNTKSFRVCADSCNNVYGGNRTKSALCWNDPLDYSAKGAKCGACRWLDGQEYCGCYKDVTANCAPKCPAGTTFRSLLSIFLYPRVLSHIPKF